MKLESIAVLILLAAAVFCCGCGESTTWVALRVRVTDAKQSGVPQAMVTLSHCGRVIDAEITDDTGHAQLFARTAATTLTVETNSDGLRDALIIRPYKNPYRSADHIVALNLMRSAPDDGMHSVLVKPKPTP